MTRDAGARTIVVGGRPEPGPMQVASGSRGAARYARTFIDNDIEAIGQYNSTINETLPLSQDSGIAVTWAGFTLRDQIRSNSTVPNQFLYIPADCRIYWSLANYNNYTQLWRDAWSGTFGDGSICVPGSMDVTNPPSQITARSLDVEQRDSSSVASFIADIIGATDSDTWLDHDGVEDGPAGTVGGDGNSLVFCADNTGKPQDGVCGGRKCRPVTFPCLNNVQPGSCEAGKCQGASNGITKYVCEKTCDAGKNPSGQCGGSFDCIPNSQVSGNGRTPVGRSKNPSAPLKVTKGYCTPHRGAQKPRTCATISTDDQIKALIKSLSGSGL